MEKRMQLELREAVEQKMREGFEVVRRDPHLIMSRGVYHITLIQSANRVIIKNA